MLVGQVVDVNLQRGACQARSHFCQFVARHPVIQRKGRHFVGVGRIALAGAVVAYPSAGGEAFQRPLQEAVGSQAEAACVGTITSVLPR